MTPCVLSPDNEKHFGPMRFPLMCRHSNVAKPRSLAMALADARLLAQAAEDNVRPAISACWGLLLDTVPSKHVIPALAAYRNSRVFTLIVPMGRSGI